MPKDTSIKKLNHLRAKGGRKLYEDTLCGLEGKDWVHLDKPIREGFERMVAVIFAMLFEMPKKDLIEFFGEIDDFDEYLRIKLLEATNVKEKQKN